MDTLNHTNIKNNNRFQIIKYILKNEDVNRKQLAVDLNLTGAAITKIINSLIDIKILEEKNYFSNKRNRKSRYLKISTSVYGILAIHFQRKTLRIAICDISGKIISQNYFTEEVNFTDISLLKQIIKQSILNIEPPVKLLACVCITPGIQDGFISNSIKNPYHWNLSALKQFIENDLNLIFLAENENNCAILGEAYFGCAKREKNIILYNIGLGIGAAAIINSKLHKTYHNGSIEIGHVSIDHKGAFCSCGNRGCLEIYTSIIDWNKKIQKELKTDQKNLMEEFFIKFNSNNKLADFYILEYSKYVAEGALILATLFSPEKIVLINNEAQYINFSPIIEAINTILATRMYQIKEKEDIKVVSSNLQSDGYFLGAIIFCLEYYFTNDLF